VKEADRARYAKEVVALGRKLAGASPSPLSVVDDDAVWEVYSGVEKLIAVLKFRLDYETPGVFTKLPDAKDTARVLQEARELLSRSEEDISGGRLVDAVETLRKARNNLRGYLTAKRKAATRPERPARGKSTAP
jgi:hypothetical protein